MKYRMRLSLSVTPGVENECYGQQKLLSGKQFHSTEFYQKSTQELAGKNEF